VNYRGVEKMLWIKLSDEEQKQLVHSADTLKKVLKEISL